MKFVSPYKNMQVHGTSIKFSNGVYETSDKEKIAILEKNNKVTKVEEKQDTTIKLATMTLAELKKEAERLGVKIEGKLTNENKGEVIKALIKKQGQ